MFSENWLLIWSIVWITTAVVKGEIFAGFRDSVSGVPIISGAVTCLLCFVIYVSAAAVGISAATSDSILYGFFIRVFGFAGLAWFVAEVAHLLLRLTRLAIRAHTFLILAIERMEESEDIDPADEAAAMAAVRNR